MRTEDGNVAITPSSIPYDELDYSQIVILDMDGNPVEGKLKPSVEKCCTSRLIWPDRKSWQ
jgi:ribulose-5-phosphate 4-epimerase/fuculose-1-phosphate aldolase